MADVRADADAAHAEVPQLVSPAAEEIPFWSGTRVGAMRWHAADSAWELPCTGNAGGRLLARRVVLATGIDGSGAWEVPAMIRDALPAAKYAHTRADI